MPLRGWMSPDGMEELLAADIEGKNKNLKEMSYDLLTDKDGLNLRPYQLNAIRAAEEAVINGKQTALLAMATGTGKTRTVLGMIYRFLKTERFRRILFLVDRTALGEQAQDVFEEVKMEDLLTLDDIYNIKGLEDKTIDKETRIHISTVQGMVKRIMYNDGETITDNFGADAGLPFDPFADQTIIKCKIYIVVGKASKQHIDKIHLRVVCID